MDKGGSEKYSYLLQCTPEVSKTIETILVRAHASYLLLLFVFFPGSCYNFTVPSVNGDEKEREIEKGKEEKTQMKIEE